MIYINLTYWFLFLALIQDWSGFILPLHGKFLCHTETPPLSTFLCPKLGNKLLITEVKLPSRTIYNSLIIIFFLFNQRVVYWPAPVPQHGGIHQADENKVVITSSGNSVTFLCICSKLSTRARDAPTVKRTRPRRIRLAVQTSCREPYALLSTEVMMDIISSALDANHFAPDECLVSTFDAQEQLQQRSSRLDIWHFEPVKNWKHVCDRIAIYI